MTNFNSLNNININHSMGNIRQNITPNETQIILTQQNNTLTSSLAQQNYGSQLLEQAVYYTPANLNFESFFMDNATALKYLQSLLNLPNSIDKFISELNTKTSALSSNTTDILVENMINLKALGQMLNESSKNAVQKLLETIAQNSKYEGSNTVQLKEILSILNIIQSSNPEITSNTIKDFLLLYIPIDFQAFSENVDFNKLSEELKQKIQNSTLSIMLETINFSNILCIVNEIENSLYIELSANEHFSFEAFKKIILELSKQASINIFVDFKINKKLNNKNQKQNFKIITGGYIPTNILILSNIIIKTIFKLDDDFAEIT